MTKKRAGLALVEVLIASSLLLLIMATVYSVFEVIRRHNFTGAARVESRQQMRGLFDRLSLLGQGASYCYAGFTGTIFGQSYSVPTPGNTGTDIILAVPQARRLPSISEFWPSSRLPCPPLIPRTQMLERFFGGSGEM